MIMDFSDLDIHVKPIIEEMDHKYLEADGEVFLWTYPQDVFKFPYEASTAENIAHYICMKLRSKLGYPLVKVEVGENRRSVAAYVSRQ
jgi:6-pyruvoyl-tetrahydropterin synthase